MIVTCTSCHTRFRVPPGKIGPKGARLRCSRCRAVFFSGPEILEPQLELDAAPPAEPPAEPTDAPPDAPAAPTAATSETEDPFWFQSAGDLLGNAVPAPGAPPGAGRAPVAPELELAVPTPIAPPAPCAPGDDEGPLSRTGARPLDPGAIDAAFGMAAEGWGAPPDGGEAGEDSGSGAPVPGAIRADLDEVTPAAQVPSAGALAASAEGPVPAIGEAAPGARSGAGPAAEAPAAEPPRRHGVRAFLPDSLWLALLVALALGLVLGWRGHLASRLRSVVGRAGVPVLEIGGVRGGLYDTSTGAPALVVRGEVVARGAVEGPVGVRVELLEGSRIVASGQGLAGASATPEDVFGATDVEQAAALRRALDARAQPGLSAGAHAPFAVVFPPPAPDPHGIELRVTAEPAPPPGR